MSTTIAQPPIRSPESAAVAPRVPAVGPGDLRGQDQPAIILDPTEAERYRRRRIHRLNTFTIPALRLVALNVVLAGVVLHTAILDVGIPWRAVAGFGLVVQLYCLASWALLHALYARVRVFDLSDLFLVLDIGIVVAAVYLTGGERSWIFFALLGRVSDQTTTTFRRVLVFAHLNSFAYLSLILYLGLVEGRELAWPLELAKFVFLYLFALHISLTARSAEALRARTTAAVRMLRDAVAQLTERTRELEIAREEADRANASKTEFLSSMSHELRTPLNAIIGYSEMLREEVQDIGRDDLDRDLLRINSSGKHLLSLINDLLDLSKVEAGKIELVPERIALAELIGDVASTVRPLLEKNGNALEVSGTTEPGEITADPIRLRQVLLNLLSNASKFTSRGIISLTVERTAGDPDWITLVVRDTGIGMTPEQLGRLFQAFSQADATISRKYGGTGLGLAISRRLVRMMGGDITVESEPGVGSAFTIRLPAEPPAPGQAVNEPGE